MQKKAIYVYIYIIDHSEYMKCATLHFGDFPLDCNKITDVFLFFTTRAVFYFSRNTAILIQNVTILFNLFLLVILVFILTFQ